MNLKFFILGLYVLVSIAQVKSQPNGLENAEMNGKPDQFNLMEFYSHAKRNILSDLFELKADEGEALDRPKRQEPSPAQAVAAAVAATATATPATLENVIKGRRFNPLEAIGSLAQKPMDLVLKQAMGKLFATYSDPNKPFGPTHDTTWGSPPAASNRKMQTEDQNSPEEVRMSTMIQPPAGVQMPAGHPGYYSYETYKRPNYYRLQNYGPAHRNFGHSLEPTLPYQQNYDKHMNGKQTTFTGPPPGYFPYNSHDQFYQENRRASTPISKEIMQLLMKYPEEIKELISKSLDIEFPKNADEVSMGDVHDKSSDENTSGETFSKTQVEFTGPQADAMIGNRRFMLTDESNKTLNGLIDKLLVMSVKGLIVVARHVLSVLETKTYEQIGERFVQLYEALKALDMEDLNS